LRISAETKSEEEKQDKGYYRAERRFGAFERVIPLPNDVKADEIQAQFRNGVLEVHLPKAKEAQFRRIPVQSGDHNGHRGGGR
jgi:HSP20 family protein